MTKEFVRGQLVPYADLQVGDFVSLNPLLGETGTFHDAVVVQVKDGKVTFVRPYVVVGDFVHSGGVSTYLDAERFTVETSTNFKAALLERRDPEQYRKARQAAKDNLKATLLAGHLPAEERVHRALRELEQL